MEEELDGEQVRKNGCGARLAKPLRNTRWPQGQEKRKLLT